MTRRISIFIPSLGGGGAERVMVTLANAFVLRGYQVDLVLVKAHGPYIPLVSPKVNIVDLNSKRLISSIPSFVKYLKANRPTLILSTINHANLGAIVANYLAGKPSHVFIRDANTASISLNSQHFFKAFIMKALMKLLFTKAEGIIAPSEGVAKDLENTIGLKSDSVEVIFNPVVTNELIKQKSEKVEHPWIIDKRVPSILAVGRLTKQKDYPTLLRAFSLLLKKTDAKLIVLGEGPERAAMVALIEELKIADKVQLLGFNSNPFAFMGNVDLFVLSSAWEGLPGTLIQALACGCPVVSTDCPSGPREILNNGQYGRMVKVGHYEELANAMATTLETPIKKGIEERAMMFSEETAVKHYLSFFGLE